MQHSDDFVGAQRICLSPPSFSETTRDHRNSKENGQRSQRPASKKPTAPGVAFTPSGETIRTGKRAPRWERDAPPEEVPVIDQLTIPEPVASTRGGGSGEGAPRRRFNLSKLKFLSGWEKLDVLNQFLAANYVDEAIATYKVIHRNGLLARVKYQDHHTMIRLLLSNPIKWREEILLVWRHGFQNGLGGVGFAPTANLYAAMIACALRWGDRAFGKELLDEMLAAKVEFTTQACNHLLQLFGSDIVEVQTPSRGESDESPSEARSKPIPPSEEHLELARKFWDSLEFEGAAKSTSKLPKRGEDAYVKIVPNVTTFTRGMELYGRLSDSSGVEKVFQTSLSLLNILIEQQEKLGLPPSVKTAARRGHAKKGALLSTQVELSLWNTYLAALIEVPNVSLAMEKAKLTVRPDGVIGRNDATLASREGTRWLNVILKVAVQYAKELVAEDPAAVNEAVELADTAWKEAWKRQLDVDAVSYGRMIVLYGVQGNTQMSEEWFEKARQHMGLVEGKGSGKLMKLRTSLLQAYAEIARRQVETKSLDETKTVQSSDALVEVGGKARELMNRISDEARSVGKKPLRSSFVFAMETCNYAGDAAATEAFARELHELSTSSPV
ncbi:hypothetical protein HDU96_007373 [Phlyctochytrium bullatum]|nr:hypothetical protein HDU96_007373 [Phlyctochytrium bullatum]